MKVNNHWLSWQVIVFFIFVVFTVNSNAQDLVKTSVGQKLSNSTLPIIGEMEFVIIEPHGLRLAARIDTGATTSSLGATKIKVFERDSEKWVSFVVVDPVSGKSVAFKRPLTRTASIKRHNAPDQKRPVVSLQVNMGSILNKSEFSLTDRSRFEFPVLIGRSYLRGNAIVDVSQKYTLSPLGAE